MVGGGIDNVIHYIRQLAGIERAGDQTDVELLDRFVKYRDEAAFGAILNRHGPLVLNVCRNIVHESHDAEDAFQATFLVLVRKARSIRKSTALQSWLYGVAYRVAVRAKADQRKRRLHEQQGVDMEAAPTSATVDSQQVDLALHEEVYRLGEKHRMPILLCYFENKTYEDAACELGWPLGTFKKRLADARELLRCRLVRLGLTVPAGLLATGLSQGAVAAAVPATLVNSTLQAALLAAAGSTTAAGSISAQAVALSEGVIQSMFLTKAKVAAAVLLGIVLLAGGATVMAVASGAFGSSTGKNEPQAKNPVKSSKAAPATPMAVITKAQIYEVDDAFYKKLSKAKRLSIEELEKLERIVLDPPLPPPEDKSLFKLLDKQKLILAGKEVKVNDGFEAGFLSWQKTVQCLPSPDHVRKGDKNPQTVVEGVSLAGIMNISWDRRFVRVKFVEKNVELEAVDKVKVLDNEGTEVVAEVPLLKEGKHSQVRDIPDGGSFLLPLSYRPDSARKQDRWWIVCITPRIYIEEEEALVRKEATKAILGKWKLVTAQRGGKPLPEDNFFGKGPTTFLIIPVP